MEDSTGKCGRIVGALVGVALLLAAAPPVLAGIGNAGNPGVLPPQSHPFGHTYGEWAAKWWQWLLSIPTDRNPNLDPTGEYCAEGQSGKVWFLGGTFGGDPVERQCTIPSGKALMLAIANAIFGSAVFDCDPTNPGVPCDVDALRTAAAASMDSVILEVSIDGVLLKNLGAYRAASPAFSLILPDDNLIGIDSGTYEPQVTDGYWLLIAPLSAGPHTIHSRAEITAGIFEGAVYDVTHHLTIGR